MLTAVVLRGRRERLPVDEAAVDVQPVVHDGRLVPEPPAEIVEGVILRRRQRSQVGNDDEEGDKT